MSALPAWVAPYQIIAEIGSVHDGSLGNACRLIEAAAAAGATAVKFQTHLADAETLPNAPMPPYFKGEPRLEYFRRTAFTPAQYRQLMDVAAANHVAFLSSPFALEAVDLLEDLGLPVYKIPSGEVTNVPLLERVAATGKPVLLSSGMSSWEEVDQAVATLRRGGPLLVMQCSSVYPCPPESVGLNVMVEMMTRYQVPVGYSDHTLGLAAPIAAATLGAVSIEKHFTFSRLMYGSDAKNSLEPAEFKQLTAALRETWAILASPVEKSAVPYADMKRIFEKSIVAASDLPAGTVLDKKHFAFKKPGDGIRADRYPELLGRKLNTAVAANTPLRPEWLT